MANNTTHQEVAEWIDDFIDESVEELAAISAKIGEDALTIAREQHKYTARTGNLQSSTGFQVAVDGKTKLGTPFTPMPGKTNPDGVTGSNMGKSYIDEVMAENAVPKGITLAMVAGMDYAAAVEAKDLDVLESAGKHVEREFERLSRGEI